MQKCLQNVFLLNCQSVTTQISFVSLNNKDGQSKTRSEAPQEVPECLSLRAPLKNWRCSPSSFQSNSRWQWCSDWRYLAGFPDLIALLHWHLGQKKLMSHSYHHSLFSQTTISKIFLSYHVINSSCPETPHSVGVLDTASNLYIAPVATVWQM